MKTFKELIIGAIVSLLGILFLCYGLKQYKKNSISENEKQQEMKSLKSELEEAGKDFISYNPKP